MAGASSKIRMGSSHEKFWRRSYYEKKKIPTRVGGGHPESPLQQARIRAGVSQEEIAEELACDPRTIQRYESGEQSPTHSMLLKMQAYYACPLSALFPKEEGK